MLGLILNHNHMKKLIYLFLFYLVGIVPAFSQYHIAPATKNVSGEHGQDIYATAIIYRDIYSASPQTYKATQCSGPTSSVIGIYYENGGIISGGGYGTCEVEFRFRKPVAQTNTVENYSFVVHYADQTGNCDTTMSTTIDITVSYTPATCDLSLSNLSATASPTSINVTWTKDIDADGYEVKYKKSSEVSWSSPINLDASDFGNTCDLFITGLTPSTTYNIRVWPICSNGIRDNYHSINKTTNPCSATGPTNLNATVWSNGTYNSYYISFTPVTGTTEYLLEYVDLDNNNTGLATIHYSTTPNEGNNLEAVPMNHNFKFRLKVPCSGAYSEWKTNTMPPCNIGNPTSMSLVNNCSYGTGGQCGYGLFTWSAVTGATAYEVQYTIYTLTPGYNPINGSFQSTSTSKVQPGMYSTTGTSGMWLAKFRMRTKCSNGFWNEWSNYTTPTPW